MKRRNPLISLTSADIRAMRDYVTPPSMTKIKGWALAGKGVPDEGTATLYGAAERFLASGPGLTGKYRLMRHELEDVEKFIERHPERMSATAKASLQRLMARRKRREWWNVVDRSGNTKLGGMAATYGPVETCPASCGMRGRKPGEPDCDAPSLRECYGGEHNTLQQWTSMQKGVTGLPFRAFLRKLRKIPNDTIRVNVIGDLPYDRRDPSRMSLDGPAVLALAKAVSAPRRIRVKVGERKQGKKMVPVWGLTSYRVRPNAFTYTHYDPAHGDNLRIIRSAVRHGLTVNLSADSLRDADRKLRYGDVAVVVPKASYKDALGRTRSVAQGSGKDYRKPSIMTPGGNEVFWCPEITTGESIRRLTKNAIGGAEAWLQRKLTKREKLDVFEEFQKKIGKTCSTCSPTGPACAWRNRKKIIGFLAHGTFGAAKNFTAAQARDLLMSPNISALDRKSVTEALARAEKMRMAEARAAARRLTKKTGKKHLTVMPRSNPGRKRRKTAKRRTTSRLRSRLPRR